MAKTVLTPLQKDFLALISKNKLLAKRFYLSGGTALTEFYLHHRFSEDLDFFSTDEFSLIPIQAFFKNISPKLSFSKIEYRNFMGLHTFFNYYPFPLIEKGKKFENLSIDSLRDIAVNKLQTIATQPRSRDFIDLYCIVRETGWDINSLQKEARNKFDYFVDPLHLGSQFLQATELKDFPKMIKPLKEKEWQNFFLEEAQKMKGRILS